MSHGVGLHVVIQSCWSASLKLFQIAFPPTVRLLEIGGLLHSFWVSHRFGEKRYTLIVISSRFSLQTLPPNDSFGLSFLRVTLWMPAPRQTSRGLTAPTALSLASQSPEIRRSSKLKHIALLDLIDGCRDPLQQSSKISRPPL